MRQTVIFTIYKDISKRKKTDILYKGTILFQKILLVQESGKDIWYKDI